MTMLAQLFSRISLRLAILAIGSSLLIRAGVCATSSDSTDAQGAEKDAAAQPPPKEEKVEIIISVNVPINANARDEFVLSPFPVEPPKVTENDFLLPRSPEELRELLRNAVLYKWGKEGQHPPDWRIDQALKLALKNSRKHLPAASTAMDSWLNEFLPYFLNEVQVINVQEQARRERFDVCGLYEGARVAFRADAAANGLTPIPLRVRAMKRGIRQDRTFVEPHFWWVVGTHSVPGLTYYWQLKISVGGGMARMFDLTEQNADLIKGHY